MKQSSIKGIAQALGISIGTVDRALHGRSRISPTTRARVLEKAEQLGYRPNVVARSLKLNRTLRIGVYSPRHIASFFDPLRAGVRAAASAVNGVNLELVFRTFSRLDEGDVELLAADVMKKYDGILITPGNPAHTETMIRSLARKGVPIVCVADDSPRSERLACVTTDAYTSGAVAAELFARIVQGSGKIAAITGTMAILDHSEKLRGFAASLAVLAPDLTFLPPIETHGKPREAFLQTKKLIAGKQLPLGIYIGTANSLPVLRALEERKLLGEVLVITTDLFAELIPYIQSGQVLATLYQRPFTQGKAALDLLVSYLVDGIMPKTVTRLAPQIVLRSNLALFSSEDA
jgi:LacI family transcriptional regulator